jgi:WD40 repeat protein/serine/threonine protein kinase
MSSDAERLRRLILDALQAERWAEALSLLEGWCLEFPEHPGSWLHRGYCLARLGRVREAVEAFDRCLELDPSSARARSWRARIASADGRVGNGGSLPSAVSWPLSGKPGTAQPGLATMAIPDSRRGWQPGTVVAGRYEIRGVARGGMAVVSIAYDRLLRRMVAVKTPLPSVLATAHGRARFQREAESWIALGIHPNLCCAYYLQEIEGMPRLFVEHVDGGDLGRWLRQPDSPGFEARLDIAIQVVSGLDYTHSFSWKDDKGVEHRGVVHRDIKPTNVLLTSAGIARITDFGLVRAEGGAEIEGSSEDGVGQAEWALPHNGRHEDVVAGGSWQTVTIEGGLVGTPPYMAPELWRRTHRGTAASDIYAFGCMLYEIFCGRRPFEHEADPAALSRERYLGEWMRLHLRQEPPEPCALNPGLPSRLGAVIRACVAKKAEARPQSFALLRDWLVEIYAEATDEPYPRPRSQSTQLLASSLNNRAVSFVTLDLQERALASLREALAIDPSHLEATFNRGLLEWQDEGLTDAELERRLSAAERNADPARTQLLRAQLRLLIDNPRGAEEALRAIDRAAEDPAPVRRELGLALLARARAEALETAAVEARDLLREVVLKSPSDLSAVVGLAQACALTGERESAEDILGAARRLDDKLPQDLGAASVSLLPGHFVDRSLALQAPVQSLLRSADGRLVVRTADGMAMIWNGVDRQPGQRWPLGGPARTGRSMAISSGMLVVCLENGPLTLFDLESGERLRNLRPHPGVAICISAAAGGRSLVSGGSDRCLRLWDLATGECERTFRGHSAFIGSVAWQPSAKRIATAGADGTVRLWNLDQGCCERILEGHRGPVRVVAFNTDGTRMYSGGQDGAIALWDPESGALLRRLRGHAGAVTSLAVTEHTLLGGGEDGTVRLWDVVTGRAGPVMRLANPVQDLLPAGTGGVWVAHGSTVSRLLLSAARSARLPLALAEAVVSGELAERERDFRRQLETATKAIAEGRMESAIGALRRARAVPGYEHHGEALSSWSRVLAFYPKGSPRGVIEIARHDAGPAAVVACDLLPDGSIVVGDSDGRLRRLGEGSELLDTSEQGVTAMAVSRDGRLIAVGGREGTIRCFDVAAGGLVQRFEGHTAGVTAIAFTPGGDLVSAGNDGTLRLWSTDRSGLPELLADGLDGVLAVAASADGRFLASAGWDGQVTVWSLPRRTELRRSDGHEGPVLAVAVSPDCRLIASAGDDGTVRLWELIGGRCVRVLSGHQGAVRRVLFTPDARFVVSAGKDATLRLWNVRSGAAAQVVEGHAGAIVGLGIDRSGGVAVSAGSDASVRLWFLDWEPEQPEQGGWDDRVRPFLEVFLRLRERPGFESSDPCWDSAELAELLRDLELRGFGWLVPERVERELRELARTRDLSRAEERQQTHELAVRRQRERRTAPARKVLENLTRNLGLKLVGFVVSAIVGVLAVTALRTPGNERAVLNEVLLTEMAKLTRERGARLRQGLVLAYQEAPTASEAPCSVDELPQYLDLALFAERRFDPPFDPGSPAPDAVFREQYARALQCVGRLGDTGIAIAVLDRAGADLHPYRFEDLVSLLAQIDGSIEPLLEVALSDHSETVRHAAALALLYSDRPAAAGTLVAMLDGDELRSAEAASHVLTELVLLGAIDGASAFGVVRRLCRSIDPRVRRNAVRALVLFERTGPARDLLEEILADRDPQVVLAAERTQEMIRSAKLRQLFGAG